MKTISALIFITTILLASSTGGFSYVGVNKCKACHQSGRDGRQYDIWRNSLHAGAYRTLTTVVSEQIAKKKNMKKKPCESQECLECHTIKSNKFKEDGVQCESCHGPGSAYKSNSIMRNKEESIANGMTEYRNDGDIEKSCITCHNKKSPTYKPFDFKSRWQDIKHPIP
jgi:excinuclease UvrABC ATPase subunit